MCRLQCKLYKNILYSDKVKQQVSNGHRYTGHRHTDIRKQRHEDKDIETQTLRNLYTR